MWARGLWCAHRCRRVALARAAEPTFFAVLLRCRGVFVSSLHVMNTLTAHPPGILLVFAAAITI